MDFTPRFHEPALRQVKATANKLEGVDREDTDVILIVRVEVRSMVGCCGLGEHANDDPEESGDLWHPSFESQEPVVLSVATLNELSHTETLRFGLSLGQRADLDTLNRHAARGAPGLTR